VRGDELYGSHNLQPQAQPRPGKIPTISAASHVNHGPTRLRKAIAQPIISRQQKFLNALESWLDGRPISRQLSTGLNSSPSPTNSPLPSSSKALSMSLGLSRALLRRHHLARPARIAFRRPASTTAEAAKSARDVATAAKEKVAPVAERAQDGIARVASSAGDVAGRVGSATAAAIGGIGGRTGQLIGTVQSELLHEDVVNDRLDLLDANC
jgi:hypothetical protein